MVCKWLRFFRWWNICFSVVLKFFWMWCWMFDEWRILILIKWLLLILWYWWEIWVMERLLVIKNGIVIFIIFLRWKWFNWLKNFIFGIWFLIMIKICIICLKIILWVVWILFFIGIMKRVRFIFRRWKWIKLGKFLRCVKVLWVIMLMFFIIGVLCRRCRRYYIIVVVRLGLRKKKN